MKNNIQSLLIILLMSFMFSKSTFATQEDLEREIRHYADIFQGDDLDQQKSAIRSLKSLGISSEQVFDSLAHKLELLGQTKDKYEIEKASWYAKALGYSGNGKYRALLSDLSENASSTKLRKYVKVGLADLPKYASWNEVISKDLILAPAGRLDQTRIINLVSAPDYELLRMGARKAYSRFDSEVIDAMVKRLQSETSVEVLDEVQPDAVAWLIKSISRTKKQEYKILFENVVANNPNKKIKKYAKKALKELKKQSS